jgi:3-dehydroquinate dehydratase type I
MAAGTGETIVPGFQCIFFILLFIIQTYIFSKCHTYYLWLLLLISIFTLLKEKQVEDFNSKICRSAFFDSLENANLAFRQPHLFAELRFDLSSISVRLMEKLIWPEKIIFTCRAGTLSEKERFEAYQIALKKEVDFIDIDFEVDLDLLFALQPEIGNSKTKLILSQHNFSETPSLKILKVSTQKAFDLGADIAKIVSTARQISDLERIYHLYTHFDRLVAFAMGELAIESRAKILFLGAPLTYATFSEKEQTAAGQLNFQQTIDLYNKLKSINI